MSISRHATLAKISNAFYPGISPAKIGFFPLIDAWLLQTVFFFSFVDKDSTEITNS